MIRVVVFIIVYLLFSLLCNIDPNKTYTWYSGIWHGYFVVPNWIMSFFREDELCKANYYTTAYNVWWWIFFVISIFHAVGALFNFNGKDRRY